MSRGKLILTAFGIGIFIYGTTEWQLKTVAKESPQTISAAALAANGPGNNANVRVTNFYVCTEDFVIEKRRRSDRWSKVWVPVVPAGQSPDMGNIRIIVQDDDCEDEMDVAAMNGSGTLDGLIINKISGLGAEERRLLAKRYPGTDFNACYILDRGRRPIASAAVLGLMGGGGFVALLGVAWIVKARQEG